MDRHEVEAYIFDNKHIGDLHPDGTLEKKGKQVELFRIYDGFASAKEVLSDPRISRLRIHYDNTQYEATVEQFLKYGVNYSDKNYEPQLVLARKFFTKTLPGQEAMF